MRDQYKYFVNESNVSGSNKAASYVRALDMLGPILENSLKKHSECSNIWSIDSAKLISIIYEYILVQQREKDGGIFKLHPSPSYWKNGFYSAALKNYKEFLVVFSHEKKLWKIVNEQTNIDPGELSSKLWAAKLESAKELSDEIDMDFQSKEGRDVLRQTKTRVNQDFFRKLVLSEYNTQCCITGLNIPDILRASHIVGWAENAKNRMNPANGLCLSATYDAAFDRHLISFDEDYRLILSTTLKERYVNEAFQRYFLSFEGSKLTLPKHFHPDLELLEKHREKIVM